MTKKKDTDEAMDVMAELDTLEDVTGEEEYAVAMRAPSALLAEEPIDLDISSVRPPYLGLVHGVGDLAEKFNAGDLVLAKEHLVCPKGETIDVIILNIDQYFKERMEVYTPGVFGQRFNTKEDAIAAGLTVEWQNGVGPQAAPAMDLTLLLRKPEGLESPMFGVDIGDGHEYSIGILSVDKKVCSYLFNDIALPIKNRLGNKRIWSADWQLHTELSKPSKAGRRTQVIRATYGQELDPALVDTIQKSLGCA